MENFSGYPHGFLSSLFPGQPGSLILLCTVNERKSVKGDLSTRHQTSAKDMVIYLGISIIRDQKTRRLKY